MIITKKAISRRTVLRGIGTTVALPLLDAMVPALTAVQNTPAKAVRRLGVVYHPNGVIYENWLPKGIGRQFELSPILAPLEPFRDKLVVVTGLSSHQAEALGDGGGDHSRASGTYLTGVHVKKSDSVVENSISMDQIAAKAFERETQLSSLQLTVDDNSLVGSCDVGYSCAYSSTLSWLTPTLPLMAENNPRVVFERLFGSSDSTDPRVRASRLRQDRSILDSVTARVKQLQQKLGPADNTKVNDYLESLRDVERRIQKAEEQNTNGGVDVDQPAGVPDWVSSRTLQLLYDLQLLAYQSDLTRVITFMYGREQTGRPYPQIGIPEPHHPLTHHQNDRREDGEVHHHSDVSRQAVRVVSGEAARDARRRWVAARSRDPSLWIGNQQQRSPYPRSVADPAARRGRGNDQGRPPPRLSRRHAVDESAVDAAQQDGRPSRENRRQHRTIHRALCLSVDYSPRGAVLVRTLHGPILTASRGGLMP